MALVDTLEQLSRHTLMLSLLTFLIRFLGARFMDEEVMMPKDPSQHKYKLLKNCVKEDKSETGMSVYCMLWGKRYFLPLVLIDEKFDGVGMEKANELGITLP